MEEKKLVKCCLLAGCAMVVFGASSAALGSTDPFILSARGGVEIWSEPQPDPAVGLQATKIVLRTENPTASVVTFENIAVRGAVHQVFGSLLLNPTPNPDTLADNPSFNGSWGDFDSHLSITASMVGGSAGGGFVGISETNDGSFGNGGLPPSSGGVDARTGIGDLAMAMPTDAFFLAPVFQGNELEFAYLVTPVGSGDVSMTLGVLGDGIVNSGAPGGASWGFGPDGADPLQILFRNPAPAADIGVTKDDGVTSAVPGQDTITYTIVVTNDGPDPDPAVSVVDVFPPDLTCDWTSVAAGGAFGSAGSGVGDLDELLDMSAASMMTYTVSCDVASSAVGTLSNTVTAITSLIDSNPGNDSATDDDTLLTPEVDLAISKFESADPVRSATGPGNLTYLIEVRNFGPSDAVGVEISELLTLPAGVDVEAITPSSGTFADPIWMLGSLPVDAAETLSVVLTVSAATVPGTDVISDTASVAAVDGTDVDPSNDSATEATSVVDHLGGCARD